MQMIIIGLVVIAAIGAYLYGLLPAPSLPDANSSVFTQIESIPEIYVQWGFCLLASFIVMLYWKKPAIKYSVITLILLFVFVRFIQPNI